MRTLGEIAEQALAVRRAMELTGVSEHEEGAFREFEDWVAQAGLDVSMGRVIEGNGKVTWEVSVATGRGTISSVFDDPRDWREACVGLGLRDAT